MRRSLTIPSLFWVVFSLTGLPNDLNTPVLAQAAAPGGPQGPVEPEPPPEQQKQLESFIIQGQQAFDKKDWVAAEKAWKAGLARAQSFNSRQAQALFLNLLGLLDVSTSHFESAEQDYTRALEMARGAGNRDVIADCLFTLGIFFHNQGQWDRALDCFSQELQLRQTLASQIDIGNCLLNLGRVYNAMGQPNKALDYFPHAQAAFSKAASPPGVAWSLVNTGLSYQSLGQFDKALEFVNRGKDVFAGIGDQLDMSDCLVDIGAIYSLQSRLDEALDVFARALEIIKTADDPRRLAGVLNDMGSMYAALGQSDEALDAYTRALEIRKSQPDRLAYAQSLHNMGLFLFLYRRDRSPQETARMVQYFEQSLDLFTALNNPRGMSLPLLNLGQFYVQQGHWDQALAAFGRAETLCQAAGDRLLTAVAWTRQGMVFVYQGRYLEALDHLSRARSTFETLNNPQGLAQALTGLGMVYDRLQQFDQAEAAFEGAMQSYEAVSRQVPDAGSVGDFQDISLSENLYAVYADLLVQRKKPEEALRIVERGRGQGLTRQAAQNRVDPSALLPPEAAAQLTAQENARTAAENDRRALANRPEPATPAARQALQKQLAAAERRCQEAQSQWTLLRGSLLAHYPAFLQVQSAPNLTRAQLTDMARQHPDTLYLEWALVDRKKALVFALSARSGLRAFALPLDYTTLHRAVKSWREALENRLPDRAQAAELYRMLFAPLEKAGLLTAIAPVAKNAHAAGSPVVRLVVVPDGELRDIPFAALMDGNGKRLIERSLLSTSVSLGTLLGPPNPRRPSGSLLCVADPVPDKKATSTSALLSGFGPLHHSRELALSIARLFPRETEKVLIGAQAQAATVRQQMGRYAVLHFATHGILNAQQGLRSWLLMADGRLEARDVAGMPLSAHLAVLSACETGRGQLSGGEGLLGLAWAFRAAGCPSILASQWQVDEVATAHLMDIFYKKLRAGERKDAALRAAMLSVRQEPGHGEPFWWAAFQLIGDTSPLL